MADRLQAHGASRGTNRQDSTSNDGLNLLLQAIDSTIVANNASRQDLKERLEGGTLKERDAVVLEMRYGLVDGSRRTLQEVGIELGLSRERVRQIEARAIRRLKRLSPNSRPIGRDVPLKRSGSTYEQTREMLGQGLSIDEVARQRGLVKSTIMGHIDRLVQAGEDIDLRPYLPSPERIRRIQDALLESESKSLVPVKEALGEDYDYGELRIVRAFMRQQGELPKDTT